MDGVVDRWWRKRRQAGLEGLEEGRKEDVLSVWKDRLLSYGWMGTSLVFLPLVRPFLSLPLPPPSPKEPTFRFSTSSRRKDIVRLRHEREPGGRDKAWLPRRGEGGASHEDFSSAFAQPKCWLAGNRAPMKLFPASSFLPCEWNRETRREDPWREEGRGKMNEGSPYWTGRGWRLFGGGTQWRNDFFFFLRKTWERLIKDFVKNEAI